MYDRTADVITLDGLWSGLRLSRWSSANCGLCSMFMATYRPCWRRVTLAGMSMDRPRATELAGRRYDLPILCRVMRGSASISECGSYRYCLRREWDTTLPAVLFVGLNPSTATATIDDPTIRRCVRFAKDWGFGSLVMANLFAYRATDPAVLCSVVDPIGPKNDWWLSFLRSRVELVIAAWGTNGGLLCRDAKVISKLPNLHCLGLTKSGHPRHPLYLPAATEPIRFHA